MRRGAGSRFQPLMLSSTLVDEVGYLSLGQQGSSLFFQVISDRHQKRSTILTTNLLCGAPHNKFNAEFIVMRRGGSSTLAVMQSFQ
jgi:DNA replication protein DnaC